MAQTSSSRQAAAWAWRSDHVSTTTWCRRSGPVGPADPAGQAHEPTLRRLALVARPAFTP